MEQSIINTNVIILKYNKSNGIWKELGSVNGQCSLSLYKSHTNVYRFFAYKISNSEVVLDTMLFSTMHYRETSAMFHQWIDNSMSIFGLNFSDSDEAKKFSTIVFNVLESLNSNYSHNTIQVNNFSNSSLLITKTFESDSMKSRVESNISYSNSETNINFLKSNVNSSSRKLSIDSKTHSDKDNKFLEESDQTLLNTTFTSSLNEKIPDKACQSFDLLFEIKEKYKNRSSKPSTPLYINDSHCVISRLPLSPK